MIHGGIQQYLETGNLQLQLAVPDVLHCNENLAASEKENPQVFPVFTDGDDCRNQQFLRQFLLSA